MVGNRLNQVVHNFYTDCIHQREVIRDGTFFFPICAWSLALQEESKYPSLTDLIQLFLCTLIVLNHRRKAHHVPPRYGPRLDFSCSSPLPLLLRLLRSNRWSFWCRTMLKIASFGEENNRETHSRKRVCSLIFLFSFVALFLAL